MDKITITDVRNKLSESEETEIINLWRNAGVLTDINRVSSRLKEVFAVAKDEQNKIIALSTYFQDIDPILKVKLHYIRAFVDEKAREFKIGTDFIVFVLNTLEKEYDSNNSELPIGGAWVLENEVVKNNYKLAVSRQSRSIFYGYHHGEYPARVRYFSNAKITN